METTAWFDAGIVGFELFQSRECRKDAGSLEKWAAEHTYRVQVIEKAKYENGEIVKTIIYISPEFKKRFGSGRLYTFKKYRADKKVIFESFGAIKGSELMLGKEVTVSSYYTTAVITDPNDPFPWWENSPYLPRWTWVKVYSPSGWLVGYKRADPVNLVWEGGTKSEVKHVLSDEGWYDWVIASDQYIYDPPQYGGEGWEEGDDMATTRTFGPRYHVRLWTIYNGKIIGSAHYEDRDHDVIPFEQAEKEISLYYHSPWIITLDYYYLYNYVSNPYNNGYATRIRKW